MKREVRISVGKEAVNIEVIRGFTLSPSGLARLLCPHSLQFTVY